MHANTMFRSNPREYVVLGLDVLLEGLTPFIEGRFQGVYGPHWQGEYKQAVDESREWTPRAGATTDVQALLKVMLQHWGVLCRPHLGPRERDLARYLLQVRNDCMHQQPFSVDDAYRALDGIEAMLVAIAAPHRREMRSLKETHLRDVQVAPTPSGPTNVPPIDVQIKNKTPRPAATRTERPISLKHYLTSYSTVDRHPRLRWWLGPMADDLLADVPYPRRALQVARWSAVGILCFILATLAFSTLPPEALPSVLVMATIDVALLYLLTRGLTWGERWRGLCKGVGYVIVFPATIILVLLLVSGLLSSVLDW